MIYRSCDQRSLRRFCLSALTKHWPNIARPLSRRTQDGIGGIFWKPLTTGASRSRLRRLVLFAAISLERRQEHGENVTQVSSAPETTHSVPATPNGSEIARTEPLNKFVPAGATQVVYNTRDEGLQFTNASAQPVRRLRYHSRQTWQWRNPTTGASLRVSYPSEEVVLIPVSGQ